MFMLIASLVITLTGCTDSSEDKKTISEDKTSITDVIQETQDLIQAIASYSADQRDEAIQRAETALNNLDERIDALENRIDDNWDQMDTAAREKARANLKALRTQRNEVASWYGSLKTSSTDAWEHTKKGFLDAYKALGDAYEKSANEFDTTK
ncbi:MAG TPA: hypothetical protein ENO22_04775 [candidate division Zixibacteria bacterium]|nr:hypothetical protein [candidate division Zixibacteria bacterium]